MPERIIFPEWRKENDPTRYPFSSRASLVNAAGRAFLEGTFLDASFYVVGAEAGLFISSVVVTNKTVKLIVGDAEEEARASAEFSLVAPPSDIAFVDTLGRPAGVVVSEPTRLAIFQSWGTGTHLFRQEQTEFCPTVCIPTPEVGLRGVQVEGGEVLTGPVWLMGGDGVVIRKDSVYKRGTCLNGPETLEAVRVDVVGDPLFRRRLCEDVQQFNTPRFIKKIRVKNGGRTFECTPDAAGNIRMFANNASAVETVLRITPVAGGVLIGAVGAPLE